MSDPSRYYGSGSGYGATGSSSASGRSASDLYQYDRERAQAASSAQYQQQSASSATASSYQDASRYAAASASYADSSQKTAASLYDEDLKLRAAAAAAAAAAKAAAAPSSFQDPRQYAAASAAASSSFQDPRQYAAAAPSASSSYQDPRQYAAAATSSYEDARTKSASSIVSYDQLRTETRQAPAPPPISDHGDARYSDRYRSSRQDGYMSSEAEVRRSRDPEVPAAAAPPAAAAENAPELPGQYLKSLTDELKKYGLSVVPQQLQQQPQPSSSGSREASERRRRYDDDDYRRRSRSRSPGRSSRSRRSRSRSRSPDDRHYRSHRRRHSRSRSRSRSPSDHGRRRSKSPSYHHRKRRSSRSPPSSGRYEKRSYMDQPADAGAAYHSAGPPAQYQQPRPQESQYEYPSQKGPQYGGQYPQHSQQHSQQHPPQHPPQQQQQQQQQQPEPAPYAPARPQKPSAPLDMGFKHGIIARITEYINDFSGIVSVLKDQNGEVLPEDQEVTVFFHACVVHVLAPKDRSGHAVNFVAVADKLQCSLPQMLPVGSVVKVVAQKMKLSCVKYQAVCLWPGFDAKRPASITAPDDLKLHVDAFNNSLDFDNLVWTTVHGHDSREFKEANAQAFVFEIRDGNYGVIKLIVAGDVFYCLFHKDSVYSKMNKGGRAVDLEYNRNKPLNNLVSVNQPVTLSARSITRFKGYNLKPTGGLDLQAVVVSLNVGFFPAACPRPTKVFDGPGMYKISENFTRTFFEIGLKSKLDEQLLIYFKKRGIMPPTQIDKECLPKKSAKPPQSKKYEGNNSHGSQVKEPERKPQQFREPERKPQQVKELERKPQQVKEPERKAAETKSSEKANKKEIDYTLAGWRFQEIKELMGVVTKLYGDKGGIVQGNRNGRWQPWKAYFTRHGVVLPKANSCITEFYPVGTTVKVNAKLIDAELPVQYFVLILWSEDAERAALPALERLKLRNTVPEDKLSWFHKINQRMMEARGEKPGPSAEKPKINIVEGVGTITCLIDQSFALMHVKNQLIVFDVCDIWIDEKTTASAAEKTLQDVAKVGQKMKVNAVLVDGEAKIPYLATAVWPASGHPWHEFHPAKLTKQDIQGDKIEIYQTLIKHVTAPGSNISLDIPKGLREAPKETAPSKDEFAPSLLKGVVKVGFAECGYRDLSIAAGLIELDGPEEGRCIFWTRNCYLKQQQGFPTVGSKVRVWAQKMEEPAEKLNITHVAYSVHDELWSGPLKTPSLEKNLANRKKEISAILEKVESDVSVDDVPLVSLKPHGILSFADLKEKNSAAETRLSTGLVKAMVSKKAALLQDDVNGQLVYFELEDLNVDSTSLQERLSLLKKVSAVRFWYKATKVRALPDSVNWAAQTNGVFVLGSLLKPLAHVKKTLPSAESMLCLDPDSDRYSRFLEAAESFQVFENPTFHEVLTGQFSPQPASVAAPARRNLQGVEGVAEYILNKDFGLLRGPLDAEQQFYCLFEKSTVCKNARSGAEDEENALESITPLNTKLWYNACAVSPLSAVPYLATAIWKSELEVEEEKPLEKSQLSAERLQKYSEMVRSCQDSIEKIARAEGEEGNETLHYDLEDHLVTGFLVEEKENFGIVELAAGDRVLVHIKRVWVSKMPLRNGWNPMRNECFKKVSVAARRIVGMADLQYQAVYCHVGVKDRDKEKKCKYPENMTAWMESLAKVETLDEELQQYQNNKNK